MNLGFARGALLRQSVDVAAAFVHEVWPLSAGAPIEKVSRFTVVAFWDCEHGREWDPMTTELMNTVNACKN
jgi:hypothetical protein